MNNDTEHNYHMFSDEGNAACDEVMLPIVSVARSLMPMLEAADDARSLRQVRER